MSRKVLVQTREVGGVTYGRVVKATEHMALQDYAHLHVEQVTRDKLMKNSASAEVSGFGFTLAGGLSLSIAEGHALDVLGRSFETLPSGVASVVVMPAAHATLPRIDLVYATLAADVDADSAPLPFRRLRTPAEILAGADPYPIQDDNVMTTRQNRATVSVRQGVAASSPAAPAAGAGEVPLYHVRVEAAAIVLAANKVTDVRNLMRSLRDAFVDIAALQASPAFLNLSEAIDDRVEALMVDSAYFTKNYNDPGNLLTLDLDIVALQSVLDARYVNVTGNEMMSGQLKVGSGGTDPYPNQVSGVHSVKGGNGATALYGYAEAGTANGDVAYGAFLHAHANRANAVAGTTSFGIYSETGGGATRWAGYFNGNTHVVGTLSKGSGTFHIDHPVTPNTKDLIHGFVESNRYALIYYFEATLDDGEVLVDLDTALGFSTGTAKKLMQQIHICAVRHPTGAHVTDDVQIADDPVMVISIALTTAPGDNSTVSVLLYAERADPFIKSIPYVDAGGRLIAEQDKPVATAEQLDLLEPLTILVPPSHPLAGQTEQETVPVLIGKQDFPWHPAVVVGGGATPSRSVTYEVETETVGPSFATVAADDASVGGVAWVNPGNVTADDADYATADGASNQMTHYLTATNPEFPTPIPETATITGIVAEVEVKKSSAIAYTTMFSVLIIKGGSISSIVNNRVGDASVTITTSEVVKSYGSSLQLWGETWTPAEINAGAIGLAVRCRIDADDEEEDTVSIGSVRFTVHYTVPE